MKKWTGLDILLIAVVVFLILSLVGVLMEDLLNYDEYTPIKYRL